MHIFVSYISMTHGRIAEASFAEYVLINASLSRINFGKGILLDTYNVPILRAAIEFLPRAGLVSKYVARALLLLILTMHKPSIFTSLLSRDEGG
jgi:hypothetical protein